MVELIKNYAYVLGGVEGDREVSIRVDKHDIHVHQTPLINGLSLSILTRV
jgi:hypothetical protein